MTGENRGFAMYMAVVAGLNFGYWQESFFAGVWMGFFVAALMVIKTVK